MAASESDVIEQQVEADGLTGDLMADQFDYMMTWFDDEDGRAVACLTFETFVPGEVLEVAAESDRWEINAVYPGGYDSADLEVKETIDGGED